MEQELQTLLAGNEQRKAEVRADKRRLIEAKVRTALAARRCAELQEQMVRDEREVF